MFSFVVRRVLAALVLCLVPTAFAGADEQKPVSASSPTTQDNVALGPSDAPVTIVNFSDFACPFSAKLSPVLQQLMDAYPGKVRLIFKHSPLDIHPQSPLAHEAAEAAAAQGKFWEMQAILFSNQKRLAREDLIAYANSAGLDVARFTSELDSHKYAPAVLQSEIESRGFGINSTPTIFINGKIFVGSQSLDFLKGVVAQQLGQPAPALAPSSVASVTRVYGLDADDSASPVRGDRNAPVTIVQFSDFECPFCRQAVKPLKQLMDERKGKVRWVFKHFPLDFHKNSMLAHEATMAAGEQGKFWEMHDLIFSNQKAMQHDDLIAEAKSLGLDVERFTRDLNSGKYKSQIASDRAQGMKYDVTGTPTFFVNGRVVNGARTLQELEQIVDQEYKTAQTNAKPQAIKTEVKPETNLTVAGQENAPVTLVWFSDVQSEIAPKTADVLKQLMALYPKSLRLVYKNLPMSNHPGSVQAHRMLMVAQKRGKFWEMHQELAGKALKITPAQEKGLAKLSGEPDSIFAEQVASEAVAEQIYQDLAEAQRRQIRGTPVVFIDGKRVDGLQSVKFYKELIDKELAAN